MDAEKSPIIELEKISKVFSTEEIETRALWEADLTIQAGEFLAVMGPSGCGKSTLLSILGLLDGPTSGRYLLNGVDVAALGPRERARMRGREVAHVFQAFNLIGDLTVLENVELPLRYGGRPSEKRKAMALEALERVGMSHRKNHYPSQLSGGQQQRVAIARAMACAPKVLLADEPTGNLDSKDGAAIMGLFSDLHKAGGTICMVTHNPDNALFADRTVRMADGQIVACYSEATKAER
jgi:putative ABC transport system ATP-binding protein